LGFRLNLSPLSNITKVTISRRKEDLKILFSVRAIPKNKKGNSGSRYLLEYGGQIKHKKSIWIPIKINVGCMILLKRL
jgi:hypothetical protein